MHKRTETIDRSEISEHIEVNSKHDGFGTTSNDSFANQNLGDLNSVTYMSDMASISAGGGVGPN